MSATLEERCAPGLDDFSSATLDERVREEVETLKSILMDDVIIKKVEDRPGIIETVIRPSTGCDVDQQYVCVTLEVTLPDKYPDLSPIVMLRNPRGLDDGLLETLHSQIKQMLHDHIGSVVIYSIVELLRGYLTNSNLPSGRCTICLFGFSNGDAFIKTQCYHYFHKHCLANHLVASKQSYTEELEKLPNWKRMEAAPFQQTCPVCRSSFYYDVEQLKEAPPPIESENAPPFELTAEMKALQKKMANLLAKQVAKGGVVGSGDTGPPPLTITTAADFADGSSTSGSGRGASVTVSRAPPAGPSGRVVPPSSTANGRATTNSTANGRVIPTTGRGASGNRNPVAAANAGRGVISTATSGSPPANVQASSPVEAPDSPSGRPAYRGPYRGFNRRAKPGRRGQNSR